MRGSQKQFSFQISRRTLYLDDAIPAEWLPLWVETLRDNVGSKMTALLERCAPRDLRDVHELCTRKIVTMEECWELWRIKNPARDPREGPEKVLLYVERLELQRPLEKINTPNERLKAAALRRCHPMNLDHSVYPDLSEPPTDLPTLEDKADLCAADLRCV